jgi:hypothetical protein
MPEETEIRVRDVRIRLRRAGRGPRALFLHGAGGVPQWLPFFDRLAERHEVGPWQGFGLMPRPGLCRAGLTTGDSRAAIACSLPFAVPA